VFHVTFSVAALQGPRQVPGPVRRRPCTMRVPGAACRMPCVVCSGTCNLGYVLSAMQHVLRALAIAAREESCPHRFTIARSPILLHSKLSPTAAPMLLPSCPMDGLFVTGRVGKPMHNVLGLLPGRSRPDCIVSPLRMRTKRLAVRPGHAPRALRHGPCAMRLVPCDVRRASYGVCHVPCSPCQVACDVHRAPLAMPPVRMSHIQQLSATARTANVT
jgi:hypothetical protein